MTLNKIPTFAHMKSMALPPALTKGRGMPVRGISFMTPPTLMNIGPMIDVVNPRVRTERNELGQRR